MRARVPALYGLLDVYTWTVGTGWVQDPFLPASCHDLPCPYVTPVLTSSEVPGLMCWAPSQPPQPHPYSMYLLWVCDQTREARAFRLCALLCLVPEWRPILHPLDTPPPNLSSLSPHGWTCCHSFIMFSSGHVLTDRGGLGKSCAFHAEEGRQLVQWGAFLPGVQPQTGCVNPQSPTGHDLGWISRP